MNNFIKKSWYVAALGNEVADNLLARKILGTSVVIYRTHDGVAHALADRCPHRQVPLSKGEKIGDEIQCWYHGLRFNSSGTCVAIPSQDNIPRTAHVATYPVVERYGFIWIWMSTENPEPEKIPDWSVCATPDFVGTMHHKYAQSDYRMGLDNFLDTSHVQFVHPETVSSPAISSARPELKVDGNTVRVIRRVTDEVASPLFQKLLGIERINREQTCYFEPASNSRIESKIQPIDDPTAEYTTVAVGIFTPETEDTCHIFSGIYRNFSIDNDIVSQVAKAELEKTINEDVEVVEAAVQNWDPDYQIVHLNIDIGGNAARTIIERLMLEENSNYNVEPILSEVQ
ncbi:MAG: Rieske 2Fe-2S domain-containing protein [Mycobacteriaceae bacterium]